MGKEQREGGREGGRERQAGRQLSEPQLLRALPTEAACGSQAGAAPTRDTQAGAGPPGLQGQAPGVSRSEPQPPEMPSLCAPLARGARWEGKAEEGKVCGR